MEIVEEVERRRQNIVVENADSAYPELMSLLEDKMSFGHVQEEKYFKNVEEGTIRAKIKTEDHFDHLTAEEFGIHVIISSETGEMDLQVKAKLLTHYPENYAYHKTVWYYAYRSLYDKFLYGSVREGYEPAVEEKLETLMDNIREMLEA